MDQHRTEGSCDVDLWFTEGYGERLTRRAKTMHRALQLCKRPPLIVETGSLRSSDSWDGDGQSTVVFADYVNRWGGLLISCDIDSAAIATAKAILDERGILSTRTLFICSSSIDLLRSLRSPIDLLYMDALDFDSGDPEPSLAHHLDEAVAAMPLMAAGSLVLIDDCDLPSGGKGGRAVPFLLERGFREALSGYQSLLVREESGSQG